jgi:hypothetical protein
MRPSPGLVLAILLVLVVAQATRLLAPERAAYLACLGLAVAGLLAGEVVAATGHLGGPSIGPIHPLLDVALMAVLEAAGAFVVAPPATGHR